MLEKSQRCPDGPATVAIYLCLDGLPEPVLDFALAAEQAAFVTYPVGGRFPRELLMPFTDVGITSGA
jgi:hypothetical protein